MMKAAKVAKCDEIEKKPCSESEKEDWKVVRKQSDETMWVCCTVIYKSPGLYNPFKMTTFQPPDKCQTVEVSELNIFKQMKQYWEWLTDFMGTTDLQSLRWQEV